MLYDLDIGCNEVDIDRMKNNDLYLAFERKNKTVTINATLRKIDKFITEQKPSDKSQLIWMRLAKLMGEGSDNPHKDVVYIENVIYDTVGDGKQFLQLSGLLFKIAVAHRKETWICSKVISDDRDPDTGKFISWTGYWINEDFKPKGT